MRLFVSVKIPDELRQKAATLASELPADAVTLVRPENMHLTLRFIGEVDDNTRFDITQKLRAIRFKPFRCELRGVGVFPDENYVRVIWAGMESDGALETLANGIIGALVGFGKDEEKRFTAHLTIARVRRKIDAKPFLAMHKGDDFGGFEIKDFELMESILKEGGPPQYKRVAIFTAQED